MKINKIYENHRNPIKTMEVLRGQEASLELSKGFYKGQQVATYQCKHPCPEIHGNPIEIYENT